MSGELVHDLAGVLGATRLGNYFGVYGGRQDIRVGRKAWQTLKSGKSAESYWKLRRKLEYFHGHMTNCLRHAFI